MENFILKGVKTFLIGTHGDFDYLALCVCKKLKQKYVDINIRLVFTSFSFYKKSIGESYIDYLCRCGIEPISYEIENLHYKNRINYSNKSMVNSSDIIVCYVDFKRHNSNAKKIIKYAIKNNKKVVNLYEQ